jgi:hypothetical protein
MTRWFVRACLLGCWAATAYGQQPERIPEKLPDPTTKDAPVAAPACGPMIEKTLCLPSVVLVPDENAVAIERLRLREVEVGRDRRCVELDFREEKRSITVMVLKERIEEQRICTTKLLEEDCLDCHGKPHKVVKQVPDIQTVKVKKYDVVPEQREVLVRVPVLKPGIEVRLKQLVVDHYSEPGIERRFHAVYHNNEIQIAIPACPFPAPPPAVEVAPAIVPHAPACAK